MQMQYRLSQSMHLVVAALTSWLLDVPTPVPAAAAQDTNLTSYASTREDMCLGQVQRTLALREDPMRNWKACPGTDILEANGSVLHFP